MLKQTDFGEINPNETIITVGIYVDIPSDRWSQAGVRTGDFIGSTSHTGDVNSPEKIMQALKAPDGTVLLVTRNCERLEITL